MNGRSWVNQKIAVKRGTDAWRIFDLQKGARNEEKRFGFQEMSARGA